MLFILKGVTYNVFESILEFIKCIQGIITNLQMIIRTVIKIYVQYMSFMKNVTSMFTY